MSSSLIFLEMNEVNFDYVHRYIQKGELPNFRAVFENHGYSRTSSNASYDELEPWIQWVSARTGKVYAEHNIFRLGDIVDSDIEQHWEFLEKKGFSVAAVSPINAANRTEKSQFWIPDPWVATQASGSKALEPLARAIKQAVNDNAEGSLTFQSKIALIKALVTMTPISSWSRYTRCLVGAARGQHWSKAILLDRLLADVFFNLWKKHLPNFSTLFLNAGAHIQHHYLFNSQVYDGDQKNPDWYIKEDVDPILEIYQLYDDIIGEALKLEARIMIATGLQQLPTENAIFYYRLLDHKGLLAKLGIEYTDVQTRMSRDFLVTCEDPAAAARCCSILGALSDANGIKLFELDNRSDSVFVTLIYSHEIAAGFTVMNESGEIVLDDFSREIVFVAVKNGHHDATGYYIDSGWNASERKAEIPVQELFELTINSVINSREIIRN